MKTTTGVRSFFSPDKDLLTFKLTNSDQKCHGFTMSPRRTSFREVLIRCLQFGSLPRLKARLNAHVGIQLQPVQNDNGHVTTHL